MSLGLVAQTSSLVSHTRSRNAKIRALADCLSRLSAAEREIALAYLSGELVQGRIGLGHAAARDAMPTRAAAGPSLSLSEVHATFEAIKNVQGKGSNRTRLELFQNLLERATGEEQQFLRQLVVGELRQGALEGVMVEAVAEVAKVPSAEVRRALMLCGDLRMVAGAALMHGSAGLARFSIELFRPLLPMLAHSANGVTEAIERLGSVALEYKLDGARIQAHRSFDEVRIFTRQLHDVTAALPEVVAAVRALPVRQIVLDGEVLALRADGRPHGFQTTMRRFGRKASVAALERDLPLSTFAFDLLHLDGADLIDRPEQERWAALEAIVPPAERVPRLVTADLEAADDFLAGALALGHEGVMAKSPESSYEAGRRGSSWLKVKPVHTLDLVILAVEWGSGRRRGWLSNLHLGARDPKSGGFVMLGKTFKGLTDEILAWQTERFLLLEERREGPIVFVKPEIVAEIAFDGILESPQYPGGVALRFARLKRYRADKRSDEADTIDTVLALYDRDRQQREAHGS